MGTAGLLLAAGAGVRAGGPKALRRFEDGVSWLERSATTLRDGGCDPVIVVVGASATESAALVPGWARTVVAEDWAEGMGASLRAGLRALLHDAGPDDASLHDASLHDAGCDDLPDRGGTSGTPTAPSPGNAPDRPLAVLIGLVDTPGVTAAVVARLLGHATRSALVRAAYQGVPGHPVLLGRNHWAAVVASARGDSGARGYLNSHRTELIECADLGSGEDLDTASPGLT